MSRSGELLSWVAREAWRIAEEEGEGRGQKGVGGRIEGKGGARGREESKDRQRYRVESGLKFGRNVLTAQTDTSGWSKSNWVAECRGQEKRDTKREIGKNVLRVGEQICEGCVDGSAIQEGELRGE